MKKLISGILLLLALQTVNAQTFNPQLAAMLQDTLDKYNALISNIKGMSASVYVPGQGTWQGCAGESYTGQPITPDMEFGIASNTKLFVAAAMLILAENNILSLDDSLSDWLPVYPNINPNVTIRQLLNHSSGIAEAVFLPPWVDTIMANPDRVFTPNEVLSWVGAPVFNPGTSWGYSNTNYILAGMIAENASGFHISQIIRDSILTPLGLDSTFYDVEEAEIGVVAHRWYNGVDYNDTSRVGLNTAGGCAGALFSNSGDMVQWYHALMTGQLLDSTSFAELTNFIPSGGPYTYGLGIENQAFWGHTLWGHGGSTWGYRSKTVYDPCMGIAVFGIANSWPAGSDGPTLLLYKTLIDYLPNCADAITGLATVCQGQTSVTYTVPLVTNATTYTWTLPSGATGTSNSNSITIDYGLSAVSSDISVRGTNTYGDGGVSTLAITVNNKPATPVITQNGNILQSDAPAGNQWYDTNGLIIGAIDQDYTASSNGNYYVVVTLSGCSSDTSNHINFVLAGIEYAADAAAFRAYPNPATSELVIEIGNIFQQAHYEILNPLGQQISSGTLNQKTIVNVRDLTRGVYILRLSIDSKTSFMKLIIEH